eukprot:14453521-Alexandrium_andersonii.AAC.1
MRRAPPRPPLQCSRLRPILWPGWEVKRRGREPGRIGRHVVALSHQVLRHRILPSSEGLIGFPSTET